MCLPFLPQEVMIDILLRLPIDTIMRCKCVCKPWCDLIESSEFATSHHSKSTAAPSCLAVVRDKASSKPYRICAFDRSSSSSSSSNSRVVSHHFGFPRTNRRRYYTRLIPHSSANGLLLMVDRPGPKFAPRTRHKHLLICNPITREYMELPPPPPHFAVMVTGFGASRVSGRYKVVMVFCKYMGRSPRFTQYSKGGCVVHTLGTGLWRSVAMPAGSHSQFSDGVFLNGNLHWLAYGRTHKKRVCCFDLETELFTSFSVRPANVGCWLSALEGRLCLCNNDLIKAGGISVWSMKIYGDGNSWAKEFIIKLPPPPPPYIPRYRSMTPVKVFKDGGDILLAGEDNDRLFLYSNNTKEYGLVQLCEEDAMDVVVYTPTFLSLQTMIGIQGCNVQSFVQKVCHKRRRLYPDDEHDSVDALSLPRRSGRVPKPSWKRRQQME